jgi:hypothetical protein
MAGKTVCRVLVGDGWDLRVEFTGGLTLTVFPDHVGPHAAFDGNWELWTPELYYSVGTDLECGVETRQYPPTLPARWRAAGGVKITK